MMTEAKVALGVLGALATVGVVAAASSSSSSSSQQPSSPTPPAPPATSCNGSQLPAGYVWLDATSLSPGDHVRISLDATTLQTVLTSIPVLNGMSGMQAWTQLLAQPQFEQALGTTQICAWVPGDALPTDWPTDDPDESTEYHAEFVYQGTANLPVSQFPLPVRVWRAGPSSPTSKGVAGGVITNIGGGTSSGGAPPAAVVQPSSSPRTYHLNAGNNSQQLLGVLSGTPITFVIDGGGKFLSVDAYATGPDGSETEISGYPMPTPPPLPWFTFTTSSDEGVIDIGWSDSSGNPYSSSITFTS